MDTAQKINVMETCKDKLSKLAHRVSKSSYELWEHMQGRDELSGGYDEMESDRQRHERYSSILYKKIREISGKIEQARTEERERVRAEILSRIKLNPVDKTYFRWEYAEDSWTYFFMGNQWDAYKWCAPFDKAECAETHPGGITTWNGGCFPEKVLGEEAGELCDKGLPIFEIYVNKYRYVQRRFSRYEI